MTAAAHAEFARFAKDLFVSDGPTDARDRNRNQQQFNDLEA
jgi:hypothetical protein